MESLPSFLNGNQPDFESASFAGFALFFFLLLFLVPADVFCAGEVAFNKVGEWNFGRMGGSHADSVLKREGNLLTKVLTVSQNFFFLFFIQILNSYLFLHLPHLFQWQRVHQGDCPANMFLVKLLRGRFGTRIEQKEHIQLGSTAFS
jgi:hypothetical protein